jgi:hypothetical protein
MGFFRSPAEKQFQKVAADFEAIVGRIAKADRQGPLDLEPFEALHSAWKEYMRETGRLELVVGSIGADSMKYPAVVEAHDGVLIAAQFVGLYTISGFKESKYGRNLDECLKPFVASQRFDDGQSLNKVFKEANPRSFDFFVSEYGRIPFSGIFIPPDASTHLGKS